MNHDLSKKHLAAANTLPTKCFNRSCNFLVRYKTYLTWICHFRHC